ncbi:hypothetical protein DES49_2590 [Halospina denitrificans]|uniref:Uncharacterized protein n=1 Tax=Halospina denitrificans TaxID=332522 RepID=A0A4R7JN36_9GAMM|nr:hypothetical protein [Halospina denitrificans]TDT38607.1 hypothetical protein DES49_2590 [Halospina denitrificans]
MDLSTSHRSSLASAVPRHALVLVAVVMALWGYAIFAPVLSTPAIAAVWLLVSALMVSALFPRKRLRRRAWLRAYFHEASIWQRRLAGGPVMWTLQMAKALVLSAFLMTLLVRLREPDLWRLMVAGVLGLVVVRSFLNRGFRPDLNPGYRPEFVWRLSLLVTGVVLVVALVLMAFLRPQPDFTEASLAQAVWHQVDQEAARSGVLHEGLRLLAAKEGVQLWLAQNLGGFPVAGWPIVVLVWLMVFVEQALFVTALLLLCNGVLSRLPPEAIGGVYALDS